MKKISTVAVKQSKNISGKKLTIGLDLGDRSSWYCVLDEAGEVLLEQNLATTPKAMREVFGTMPRCRMALETGMHSPWVSRLLSDVGHEVIVAHARNVRLIGESLVLRGPTEGPSRSLRNRLGNYFHARRADVRGHKRARPDVLILAGINTHACVRVTAIDAYQRDWRIIVAADCVDSYDREHHDISMKYMKDKIATVMTNQEVRSALAANSS